MNTLCAVLISAFLLTGVTFAHAGASDETRKSTSITIDAKDEGGPERITPRQQAASGKSRLLSTNQWSEMMLKDDAVYLQLTDFGLKQVADPKDGHDKDEGFLGNMLKAVTLNGVKQLLNHGLALSLADSRSALVRDGEVILITCQGKEVFNRVKINDKVQKYPQENAEEFVRSVNRARTRLPACRS